MHKPEPLIDAETFDLAALERELRNDAQYERSSQVARTLVRTSDQRIVLMVLRAGAKLAEHHADATVSIQVLTGHVHFHLPSRALDVKSGGLLVLSTALRHDVVALEDSALLLTLGWTPKT